jgi:streptogramin lyase
VAFDPETETFETATGNIASAQTGIAEGPDGNMYMNHWNDVSIYPIDMETMVTGDPIDNPHAGSSCKGVSVDKDGHIWTPCFDDRAYRYDLENDEITWVEGLDYPYTYSDMTGGALTGVTCGSPTG